MEIFLAARGEGEDASNLSRPTSRGEEELYHGRKRDNCARPISPARTRQVRDALIKLIPVIEAFATSFECVQLHLPVTVFHGKTYFSLRDSPPRGTRMNFGKKAAAIINSPVGER